MDRKWTPSPLDQKPMTSEEILEGLQEIINREVKKGIQQPVFLISYDEWKWLKEQGCTD